MNHTSVGMNARHRYGKARDYAFGIATLTLREKAHLTQQELATHIGISTRALQNWESGSSYPKSAYLRKLIEIYVLQHAFTPGKGGMQVTHLWKSGISPILNRAGLAEKQEQVTSQLKFGVSCDQNWSK